MSLKFNIYYKKFASTIFNFLSYLKKILKKFYYCFFCTKIKLKKVNLIINLNSKAIIQLIQPYLEEKVRYFILAHAKTENPNLDKKKKTIINFQTK